MQFSEFTEYKYDIEYIARKIAWMYRKAELNTTPKTFIASPIPENYCQYSKTSMSTTLVPTTSRGDNMSSSLTIANVGDAEYLNKL
jgi:hypothetical protein